MATQPDTTGWRAWAAFYLGIAQAKADPRFQSDLEEAIQENGLLDTEDDDEYQRVLGTVLRALFQVPIVVQKELTDGQEGRTEQS